MSGVRAAQGLLQQRHEPVPTSGVTAAAQATTAAEATEAMQDVLYDILAVGVDPEQGDAPTEHIERFLFEHARSPKSAAEFEAFFVQHGLNARRSAAPSSDAGFALPPLESPPLDEAPAVLQFPVDEVYVRDELPTGQHALLSVEAPPPRPWGLYAMGAALVLLCLGLGAIAWVGHGIIGELRGDLNRAAARSDLQERVIDQLEGRAAGIQSSIEANGQLIHRMEQKSDLLIDTLVTEPEPPRKPWRRK